MQLDCAVSGMASLTKTVEQPEKPIRGLLSKIFRSEEAAPKADAFSVDPKYYPDTRLSFYAKGAAIVVGTVVFDAVVFKFVGGNGFAL
jgi:hypothetical protein